MATPVLEKNGKTYGIRCFFVDNNGNRKQKYKGGFATKKEANNWAKNFIEFNKINSVNITQFFELCKYFMNIKESSNLAPVTIADYDYYINKIKNDFGNIRLNEITTPMLQMYLNSFDNKPCLQKHIKQTLSAIFKLAYAQNIIISNPFEKTIKPLYKQKEIMFYNQQQLSELLTALKNQKPKYYAFALLLAYLGLRPNEATALLVTDIIKENSDYYVIINKNTSIVKNKVTKEKNIYIKEPKSIAGKRIIPINKYIHDELYYYKILYKIESEFILCDENGKPILLNSFNQALKKLTIKNNLPQITPYGLRHTFGNLNKNLGNDSYTVSKLMGHSDPSITEKYYYHNDLELNKNSMNKLLNTLKTS